MSTLRPATDCDAAETFRVTSNSRSGASRDAATSSTVPPTPIVEESQLAPVLLGGVARREAPEQHGAPQPFIDLREHRRTHDALSGGLRNPGVTHDVEVAVHDRGGTVQESARTPVASTGRGHSLATGMEAVGVSSSPAVR